MKYFKFWNNAGYWSIIQIDWSGTDGTIYIPNAGNRHEVFKINELLSILNSQGSEANPK